MKKIMTILLVLLNACSHTPATPTEVLLVSCQKQRAESEKDLDACLSKLEEVMPLIQTCPQQ